MFCCFPTKLSRVLHEQGREQLNRGWGSARSPNCTGFSYEEISQLDFSKIDLEEVFEDKIKSLPDIEEKLNAFETRLQDVQSSMQRAKLQRSS
jgi:conjugal transfer mating pair stabilization protein TraN